MLERNDILEEKQDVGQNQGVEENIKHDREL